MDDKVKFLNMLGLCRRAGKLFLGHDAVMDCIVRKKAFLVILAADSSERLKNEVRVTAERSGINIKILLTAFSMEEIGLAVGKYAAVLAVTDKNFASRLTELFGEEQYR